MGNVEGRAAKKTQAGEREKDLSDAFRHGMDAARALGFDVHIRAVLETDPGAWACELWKGEERVPNGSGLGKGSREAARVGALFEALEHYVSESDYLGSELVQNVSAHAVADADGLLYRDQAVRLLGEFADEPIGCLEYRELCSGLSVPVPIFLSTPGYVDADTSFRASLGDNYDYSAVWRYSSNNGWAAGVTTAEATVHALNEVVERDALSLLLIGQFLRRRRRPLRVVDRESLPGELADLAAYAEKLTGRTVYLLDMTTDVSVPAFLAFLPPENGMPARVRGCGASLSSDHAAYRALTELVQIQGAIAAGAPPASNFHRDDSMLPYPPMQACRRADFTARLPDAHIVPFKSTSPPAMPQAHLEELLRRLSDRGYSVLRRQAATPEGLAVVSVLVPGMERFMLVTDGILVLPGPRGQHFMEN
ncbi:YcaO-like family protein [Streptomyces yaanensis]|uniref:YcaO-like family protein n=1 Tax=Streptomyces yaanensis TaxID=1142239 RepID=A0ABV7SE57_9ACTN|nr:YcaO-like family protein [Streptomyces sp. CGMCC 4.7035]WNB99001.1 YcaO-like family protein [Streptomyces sp. CGMCC 4.7035]